LDRAGCTERAGEAEKAERRRKKVMARQGGYRLAEERSRHGLTQAQLSRPWASRPSAYRRSSAAGRHHRRLARYIEALGGRLDLVANLGDHTFTVATTEAA
jgi:hypothetical protein